MREATWRAEIAADGRFTVIVDDDPTGTQAVSDVEVILRPGRAAFDAAAAHRSVFVLSNSRALPEREAAALVGIARTAQDAARTAGRPLRLVLRGDSTLRGHVFAEVDAVSPGTPVLFVAGVRRRRPVHRGRRASAAHTVRAGPGRRDRVRPRPGLRLHEPRPGGLGPRGGRRPSGTR